MNFYSITGLYGKEVQTKAIELLEHGYIYRIDTYEHTPGKRSPNIGKDYEVLEKIAREKEARILTRQ